MAAGVLRLLSVFSYILAFADDSDVGLSKIVRRLVRSLVGLSRLVGYALQQPTLVDEDEELEKQSTAGIEALLFFDR